MFQFFGILNPGPKPEVPGSEAPFKKAWFGGDLQPSDHAAYSKAESDEAFLTCKCHEPSATPDREPIQLRFVELFKPPYF
jgi:hypothetical protein